MIHILHLPVFPKGSPINPDAINDFLLDGLTSDIAAHIVIGTNDDQKALRWATEFLETNPEIPRDEVRLTRVASIKSVDDIKAYSVWIPFVIPGPEFVIGHYLERKPVTQEIIDLPITY